MSTILTREACDACALLFGERMSSREAGDDRRLEMEYSKTILEWITNTVSNRKNRCLDSAETRLVRVGVGLLGSLDIQLDRMDVARVLDACSRVVIDSGTTTTTTAAASNDDDDDDDDDDGKGLGILQMDVCMEGLEACRNVVMMHPTKDNMDVVGRVVESFLKQLVSSRTSDDVCVRGFLCALRAHPVATLDTLVALVRAHKVGEACGKACVMACVDHAYRYVAEYEPDIVLSTLQHGVMSMLEHAVKLMHGDMLQSMVDSCQRGMLELMRLIPMSVEEGSMVHEVVGRLACQVASNEMQQPDTVMGEVQHGLKDVEEGELLGSVCDVKESCNIIEGIVPIKVTNVLKITGVPDTVLSEAVRDACDAFTGVKSVERDIEDNSILYVTCTSMPGTVRCYEAMYTRGKRFWTDVGCDGCVPEVHVASCSSQTTPSSMFLLIPGVQDVDEEDAIKKVLEQGRVPSPSSLIPLNIGVHAGVILCFGNVDDATKAFTCLGGIEDDITNEDHGINAKRERELSPRLDEKERKKARSEEHVAWSGRILRNKQLQCLVNARRLEPFEQNNGKIDNSMTLDWPQDLEVNQRADIQYVCGTLISTVPKQQVHLSSIYPATHDDEQGLLGFDTYLKGKKRAGVVILSPQRGMQKRTLYLIPVSDQACFLLHIDPRQLPSPAIIGMVVDQ